MQPMQYLFICSSSIFLFLMFGPLGEFLLRKKQALFFHSEKTEPPLEFRPFRVTILFPLTPLHAGTPLPLC